MFIGLQTNPIFMPGEQCWWSCCSRCWQSLYNTELKYSTVKQLPSDCILSLVTFLTFLSSHLINTSDASSCEVIQRRRCRGVSRSSIGNTAGLAEVTRPSRFSGLGWPPISGYQTVAVGQRGPENFKVTRDFYCPSVKLNPNPTWAELTLSNVLMLQLSQRHLSDQFLHLY